MFIPLKLTVSVDVPLTSTTRNFGLSQTDTLHRPRKVSGGLDSCVVQTCRLFTALFAARLLPALLVYISLLGDVHVLNLWIPGRCKAYGNNIELTNLALGLEITPTRDRATERLLILTLRSRRHASTVRCRLLGLHAVIELVVIEVRYIQSIRVSGGNLSLSGQFGAFHIAPFAQL